MRTKFNNAEHEFEQEFKDLQSNYAQLYQAIDDHAESVKACALAVIDGFDTNPAETFVDLFKKGQALKESVGMFYERYSELNTHLEIQLGLTMRYIENQLRMYDRDEPVVDDPIGDVWDKAEKIAKNIQAIKALHTVVVTYSIGFTYTNDDDGVHVVINGVEIGATNHDEMGVTLARWIDSN